MASNFFYLGFTPYKAEQPLRGMELKEKEEKDEIIEESCIERAQGKKVSINSRLSAI